jgi:hypothetical protein
MDTSQQLVILGGLITCQAIAIGLPYWMGRQAGKAAADVLRAENLRLTNDLAVLRSQVITLDPVQIIGADTAAVLLAASKVSHA